MASDFDDFGHLAHSLEPCANIGHSFTEASIKRKGKGQHKGSPEGQISEGESVTNKELLTLDSAVKNLKDILNFFD